MGLFDKLFKSKENAINSYPEFWKWFSEKSPTFFEVVKSQKNIEKDFFDKLSEKLNQITDDVYFLTGMFDEKTAELILTPEGIIKNIVFVEELIKNAPEIPNWKFTALKPETKASSIDFGVNMNGYTFEVKNINFYPIENKNYPDEIDLVIVYDNYKEEDKKIITNGIYIFLDNYLGELNSVTIIDNLSVIGKEDVQQELISIEKLKDYLIWREKEFIEKYQDTRHNTENDAYASMEATLQNELPLIAIVNTSVLEWEYKASHPWILRIDINYDGKNNNGFPNSNDYALMNTIEDELLEHLKDIDGYLNIGRETANNLREIFFACREFRNVSKITKQILSKYSKQLELDYVIYKDKYWKTFDRFRP